MKDSMHGRRLFLRGAAGVVLALPFLETFAPRRARADTPPAFRFAIFVRQGNGCQQKDGSEPERFWPSQLGPLTTASMKADGDRAVNELADHASKLLLVRGCEYKFSTSGCGHADGGLQCLTAQKPDGKNSNKSLAMGESLDFRIVRELEPKGSEPLNLYAGSKPGYLDDVLSYRGAKDRVAAEGNPYNAYKRMFGLPDVDMAAAAKVAAQRKSVNDVVRDQMTALMSRKELSKSDVDRLKIHFDAIRDLEVKLACQLPDAQYQTIAALAGSKTVDDDDQIEVVTRLQMDVMALAASCGLSHAMTLQIGCGNDQTQYTINGVKQERFHHISHRINGDGDTGDPIPNADLKHHEIDKMFARQFKYLLDRLSSYKTPTGTVLDQGVAIWLNDLGAGVSHSSRNLPYVCAGSCGGALKTGAYVDAGNVDQGKFASHNKFLSTIGAAVGCKNAAGGPLDDFGDASLEKGRIAQMLPGLRRVDIHAQVASGTATRNVVPRPG